MRFSFIPSLLRAWRGLGPLLAILALVLLAPRTATAQVDEAEQSDAPSDSAIQAKPRKPLKLKRRAVETDSTTRNQDAVRTKVRKRDRRSSGEPVVDFPNLGKLAFYRNKKELRAIRRAEKRKKYGKAFSLMRAYVGKFSTENFAYDNRLLWRLAQLCERVKKDTALAKVYYRLALKHRRNDIKRVQLYYDSLDNRTDRDLYVDLKYYYELVEYRKNVATFPTPRGINTVLGEEINSKHPDYGPAISPSNDVLVFSSKRILRGLTEVPDEELYYSKREGGYWAPAKAFPKPISSPYNEGSACLSRDGHTLVFARCECPDCNHNCDLFISTLNDDSVWTTPRNLGPNVNSISWDSQPSLSPSGDTLYFASDRKGGFGLSDIWFSRRLRNGTWTKAQNLGPTVNTRESEVSPYFHPLYQVLYFSSRGQLLNFGDFDIYKTYRVGKRWQEPRNIGPLVNGKGPEYYFTIDADSKFLYYARAEPRDPKNLDLYSFPLPMEAQPTAITHLEGVLKDSVTNLPLKGIVSIVDLTNGIEVASRYIREDGSFDFDLIDHARYAMLIQSPDYFTIEKQLDLQTDTLLRVMTTLINYQIPLVFQNLEFEPNKANITPAMKPILDRIKLFLVDHPTFKLDINGHTDTQGDPQENLELSQFRALAIKQYIAEAGQLDENRINANGFGSSAPLRVPEATEADRKMNRRVEFKLIRPEGDQQPGFDEQAPPPPPPSGGQDGNGQW